MAVKTVKTVKKTGKSKIVSPKAEHYFEAVGRRKSAIARVRLYTKKTNI